jgi:hypothetical protein
MFSLLVACGEDNKFEGEWPTAETSSDITLAATASVVDFAAAGGSGTLTITASHTWTVGSDEDWLTFSSNPAGSKNATLEFTVEGRSGEIRIAYITVTSGSKSVVITVTQTGTAPGTAELTAALANEYPDTTVTLTATVEGATKYIWLHDGTEFDTTTGNKYVLGITDTTLALSLSDFRGQHSYTVRGVNAEGASANSSPVSVTLKRLQDMPLPYAPTISGKNVNDRADSLDRTVWNGVRLTPSIVPGATTYIWTKDGADDATIDISAIPDSVLYGKEGKGGKIDSILSYSATASGIYTVKVSNDAALTPESNPHEVTINTYVFGWKDDITQKLAGTWTATTVTATPYDTLGDVQSAISSYALKISKVDASTIKIVTDFGVFGDTAVITAKVGLSDESISIASQKVVPAASSGKLHAAYTPAYIAFNESATPANNAGKGIEGLLGGTTTNPTIDIDNYLIYRGTGSGAYTGHPTTRNPIVVTTGTGTVTWTKQ